MFQIPKNLKLIFIVAIFLVLPLIAEAGYINEKVNFHVDPSYDLYQRTIITASLKVVTSQLYFYIDDDLWNTQNFRRQETLVALQSLGAEFENKIYPTLTSTFGFESKPGVDGDNHITILIHQMKGGAGGYSRTNDGYSPYQVFDSNQREMFYLNSKFIEDPLAKSFMAHEFTHLIAFNQKDKEYGVSDEVWLNEVRSEYAPTLVGYDDVYEGSNLERRVRNFISNPYNSLTEWENLIYDYGVVNIFTQYLVDHYGVKVLVDSLQSSKVGIPSINEALIKNGFKENFSQIFTDWTIAVFVNDCNLGDKYCYKNPNLKNLRVVPLTNYLPTSGESTLSVANATKDWAGNWHKFAGGKGTLKIEFVGNPIVTFKIPYLTTDTNGNYKINFFVLDNSQKGKISIPNFGTEINSLIAIPSIQSKISGFDGMEDAYNFSWTASTVAKTSEEGEQAFIQALLAQIESLTKEIARVQAQINAILGNQGQKTSCSKFENNLYFGLQSNSEVRCLQEFLKSKGAMIYPEGIVSGNYLSLTLSAVKKYQASQGIIQTGYFGPLTRAAANKGLTGF